MNYIECCDWMFSRFPSYQKYGKKAFKPGLETINKLTDNLQNQLSEIKIIHIAGTNGKGSTSNMLSSVLMESGYTIGLFTSPHFLSFTERIQINGEYISEYDVENLLTDNKQFLEENNASFFEISLWLSLVYFIKNKVDIIVLETGLGGRLDATNFIKNPLLSIITNISLDHTEMLGDTLEKIAFEKAGIIKKDCPVLIGEYQPEVEDVFKNLATKNNASIYWTSNFKVNLYKPDLKGKYQEKNAQTVFSAANLLKQRLSLLTDNSIQKGIENSQNYFFLPARWQKLNTEIPSVFDMGHNKEGIKNALLQLKNEKYKNLYIVFSAVKGKNINEVLSLLPKDANYFFAEMYNERSEKIENIEKIAKNINLNYFSFKTVSEAYSSATQIANKEDLVLTIGSSLLISEIFEKYFKKSLVDIKNLTIFAPSSTEKGN